MVTKSQGILKRCVNQGKAMECSSKHQYSDSCRLLSIVMLVSGILEAQLSVLLTDVHSLSSASTCLDVPLKMNM